MTEAEKALYADVCWLKLKLEELRADTRQEIRKINLLEACEDVRKTLLGVRAQYGQT